MHHARHHASHGAILAATLLACLLASRSAVAGEGIYLNWNDCVLGATHTSNLDFACGTNSGSNDLFCAFTMPQAADNVVAIDVVVDIQHSGSSLPDWWRLDVGGCRQGNLQATPNPGGRSACVNMWQGTGAIAGVQAYLPTEPRGGDSQARIKVSVNVLPAQAVSVDGTSMYYGVRLTLINDKTVGPGSCQGCDQAACLVLNSIQVGRLPNSSGGDYFLQTPGVVDANWARWQGGNGADCAAVPVRNRAWGQVKSLYR